MTAPATFARAMLALLVAAAAASPARAQGPLGLWPEPVDGLVRDALETPHATAQLAIFAAAVRKHGDAECLKTKALDDGALVARGRMLLQSYGIRMTKVMDENFDRSAYQAALSASAGRNAVDEIERLKRDPDVRALIALDRPARLARLADTIIEQFDRYVLIRRIKLDPVSPLARGEAPADSADATEAAVQRFLDQHRSPRIDRYLHLLEAAKPKGLSPQAAPKLGPAAYFGGVERDLAELCVGGR
jgi:hypothetical protein